jgi:hypothetical protein
MLSNFLGKLNINIDIDDKIMDEIEYKYEDGNRIIIFKGLKDV